MKTYPYAGLALLGLTLTSGGIAISQPAQQTKGQRETLPNARGTATITGRVVYEDGRPAANIPVAAEMPFQAANEFGRRAGHNSNGGYLKQWVHTYRSQAVTCADGTYSITGLATAPYNLTVNYRDGLVVSAGPEGYVAAAVENVAAWQEKSAQAPDIVLSAGSLIRGKVLDKGNGQPLKGVLLICKGPQRPVSGSAAITAVTDEQGNFALRVTPGANRLYIAGPGVSQYEFNGKFLYNGEVLDKKPVVVKSGGLFYAAGNKSEITADDSAKFQVRDDYLALVEVQVAKGRERQLTFRLPQVTKQM